jgi:hypothetical protein
VIGFLYDHSLPALIAFSVVAELAAIPFFLVVARHQAADDLKSSPSHVAK